jgi:acyl-CoA thioester hydrolase
MEPGDSPEKSLSEYPVVITLPVQWGDQDGFGHVNNTIYFRWFESGRIAYLTKIGLMEMLESDKIGPIMATISCDFRRPITYPDTVDVGSRVTRIGNSSVGMDHVIVSRGLGVVAAEGTSTLVVVDYRSGKSHPVPAAVRRAIEALERRVFD